MLNWNTRQPRIRLCSDIQGCSHVRFGPKRSLRYLAWLDICQRTKSSPKSRTSRLLPIDICTTFVTDTASDPWRRHFPEDSWKQESTIDKHKTETFNPSVLLAKHRSMQWRITYTQNSTFSNNNWTKVKILTAFAIWSTCRWKLEISINVTTRGTACVVSVFLETSKCISHGSRFLESVEIPSSKCSNVSRVYNDVLFLPREPHARKRSSSSSYLTKIRELDCSRVWAAFIYCTTNG